MFHRFFVVVVVHILFQLQLFVVVVAVLNRNLLDAAHQIRLLYLKKIQNQKIYDSQNLADYYNMFVVFHKFFDRLPLRNFIILCKVN